MKMYTFDDCAEQIEKSYEAIRAAGHEVAIVKGKKRVAEELAKNDDRQDYLQEDLFQEVRVAVAEMVKEGGGIITDLMFHNIPHDENSVVPPAGLLVVIECMAHGVPVMVCTDEDHHGKAVSWIYDGYIKMYRWLSDSAPPFGWVDNKDWDRAVALLAEMRAKMDAPTV